MMDCWISSTLVVVYVSAMKRATYEGPLRQDKQITEANVQLTHERVKQLRTSFRCSWNRKLRANIESAGRRQRNLQGGLYGRNVGLWNFASPGHANPKLVFDPFLARANVCPDYIQP